MPPRIALALASALTVLAAGCVQPDEASTGGNAPIGSPWREHEHLGPLLVDAEGRTLYVSTRDAPNATACVDTCAATWPPAPADAMGATTGALGVRVGNVTRPDGTTQLAIDARPLYRYSGDTAAGDANGQGREGIWFVVRESDVPGQLTVDLLDGPGEHTVRGSNVTFGNASGYLSRPTNGSGFPGVVMMHEWWGLNEHIRAMADALASHGYTVIAVDLFHGSVANDSEEAMAQVQAFDAARGVADMRAAARHLREEEGALAVAALGWCFGGGQSLQLALAGEPLNATILYYGRLDTDPANLSAIDGPLLGIFGAEDASIPVSQVRAFESALAQAGVDAEIHVYDDVGHAFANPSGEAYAPKESMDAWARTLAFLDAHLKPTPRAATG